MTYIKCEEGIQTYPKIKFETSKIPNTIKNRCLTIKIAKNLLDVKERSINPIPKHKVQEIDKFESNILLTFHYPQLRKDL